MTAPSKVEHKSLIRLDQTYRTLCTLTDSTEVALNAARNYPELEVLLNKLRDTDRQLKEMLIAQADKTVPVNIGGEDVSLVDTLNDADSSAGMLRRTQAKKLARRLYAMYHPDRGGSITMFNTIRKAANAGDLETLYFFRIKDGVDEVNEITLKDLQDKLDVKLLKFKGKSAWGVASAYYSGGQNYVAVYTKLLEAKIHSLNMQMFGLDINKDRSAEE